MRCVGSSTSECTDQVGRGIYGNKMRNGGGMEEKALIGGRKSLSCVVMGRRTKEALRNTKVHFQVCLGIAFCIYTPYGMLVRLEHRNRASSCTRIAAFRKLNQNYHARSPEVSSSQEVVCRSPESNKRHLHTC